MTDRHLHAPHNTHAEQTSKGAICLAVTDTKHHKPFKITLWGVKINVR